MPSKRKSSACVDYVPALCTHRPSLLPIERFSEVLGLFAWRITLPGWREDDQTVAFRGSKSRNKVSVGEPAEGSLSNSFSSESSLKKPRALLPRVFGLSALDFDVRWVRSGRQVCLNSPWTASWRVLLKLKALRPFQEVNCCSPVRSSATVD